MAVEPVQGNRRGGINGLQQGFKCLRARHDSCASVGVSCINSPTRGEQDVQWAHFWFPSNFTNTDHCLFVVLLLSKSSRASICLGWSTKRRTIAPCFAASSHRSDRSVILFIATGSPYKICFRSLGYIGV